MMDYDEIEKKFLSYVEERTDIFKYKTGVWVIKSKDGQMKVETQTFPLTPMTDGTFRLVYVDTLRKRYDSFINNGFEIEKFEI